MKDIKSRLYSELKTNGEFLHEAKPQAGTESKTFQNLHCYT